MKKIDSQRGSHHAILVPLIVVALIGTLGFVGFNAWKKQSADAGSNSTTVSNGNLYIGGGNFITENGTELYKSVGYSSNISDSLAFSRDGLKVAGLKSSDDSGDSIVMSSSNGSLQRTVFAPGKGYAVSEPSFSSDNTSVLLSMFDFDYEGGQTSQLIVADYDGSTKTVFTTKNDDIKSEDESLLDQWLVQGFSDTVDSKAYVITQNYENYKVCDFDVNDAPIKPNCSVLLWNDGRAINPSEYHVMSKPLINRQGSLYFTMQSVDSIDSQKRANNIVKTSLADFKTTQLTNFETSSEPFDNYITSYDVSATGAELVYGYKQNSGANARIMKQKTATERESGTEYASGVQFQNVGDVAWQPVVAGRPAGELPRAASEGYYVSIENPLSFPKAGRYTPKVRIANNGSNTERNVKLDVRVGVDDKKPLTYSVQLDAMTPSQSKVLSLRPIDIKYVNGRSKTYVHFSVSRPNGDILGQAHDNFANPRPLVYRLSNKTINVKKNERLSVNGKADANVRVSLYEPGNKRPVATTKSDARGKFTINHKLSKSTRLKVNTTDYPSSDPLYVKVNIKR